MREQSKGLRKTLATVFQAINSKNLERGINAQYKYEVNYLKDEKSENIVDTTRVEVSLIMKEMGYKDVTLQTFGFIKPNSLDKFTFEYNVFISILSALTETSLITYTELGKSLNKDTKFQKEAINSLKNDKETNSNTVK